MFDKLRYTSSSFFAVIFTLVTFVGMSMLIAPSSYRKTTELEIGDFSSVRDMKAPNVTQQPKKKIPPKQEKVKPQPVAPPISVTTPWTRTRIEIPQGSLNTNLETISTDLLPNLDRVLGDDFGSGSRGLISTLSVQPIYPIKQVMNKTEGWVKVQFTVNEFGNVVDASVIEAEPARLFNNAALKAIKKSKFKPLKIDGIATAQTATQTFEFKINKD